MRKIVSKQVQIPKLATVELGVASLKQDLLDNQEVLAKALKLTNDNLNREISARLALEEQFKGVVHLSNFNERELLKVKRSLLKTRVLTGTFILMTGVAFAALTKEPSAVIAAALAALIYYLGSGEKI